MCVVSMVTQHYFGRYPRFDQFPPTAYPDYTELIRKARLYDEMMRQKDCPDPQKDEWNRQLTDFMRRQYGLEPK